MLTQLNYPNQQDFMGQYFRSLKEEQLETLTKLIITCLL